MITIFKRTYLALIVCILSGILCGCGAEETLPSWNDASANKQAIIDFVESVTNEKSDNYVPVEERIATFDMDGTIVVEKKIWLELAVAVYRIDNELSDDKDLVAEKDELLEKLSTPSTTDNVNDMSDLIIDVTGKAFQGMSQEDFVVYMERFMQEEKPDFPGLAYKDCFYKPMLELIQYLQDNDFTVYLVSGSERGVVWGAASEVVKLPRSQMIGGDITLIAEGSEDSSDPSIFEPGDTLVRGLGFTQSNVKMDKVYNIFHQIGIRPILACGNTDGDFAMLNYAKYNPDYAGLALLIKHDDNEREYQYNTEDWDDLAERYGWNVISMKNEFDTIFLKDAEKVTE